MSYRRTERHPGASSGRAVGKRRRINLDAAAHGVRAGVTG